MLMLRLDFDDESTVLKVMGAMPWRHAEHILVLDCKKHILHRRDVDAMETMPTFDRRAVVYGRNEDVATSAIWHAWHMRLYVYSLLGSTLSASTYRPHVRQNTCSRPLLDIQMRREPSHLGAGLTGGDFLHGIQTTELYVAASM